MRLNKIKVIIEVKLSTLKHKADLTWMELGADPVAA